LRRPWSYSQRGSATRAHGGRVHHCDVVFQAQSAVDPPRQITAFDMLFTLGDLEGTQLAELAQRWFEISDRFGRVADLLFSMRRSTGAYLENKYLSYVQAAELLHRLNPDLPQVREPASSHSAKVQRVLDAVEGEETRTWLANELRWSNEPRLRRRLRDLRDRMANAGTMFPNSFVAQAVDTRNYLTHYGDELKHRSAQGTRLYYLGELMRFFVQASLLIELGFTDGRLAEILTRNRHFGWLQENWASPSTDTS
jgi:ApeA N-terminal domain 1